jgi:pimeloyl-ACP methyl ester carboxylesterase
MPRSEPVDGFRLAYDRSGSGEPVVLLHGWPGDRTDYRILGPALAGTFEVVVPDLRGFGESDKHPADPAAAYDASAQARGVAGLIRELGLDRPVVAGYDIGSRIAQTLAAESPGLVRALVVAPPLPGIGRRVLDPQAQSEFWYQAFHRLPVATELIDGKPWAVRTYLSHFWAHWSGPSFVLDEDALAHLASGYSPLGAFTASIGWYRAGAGSVARSIGEQPPAPEDRLAVPTTVLWPEHDPLFPRAWSDRLDEFFSNITLSFVDGAGHFAPLEYPAEFATAIRAALARTELATGSWPAITPWPAAARSVRPGASP